MRYALTGEEMRNADAYTIRTLGMPSLVLMERASLAVRDRLLSGNFDLHRVLVVCGTGNNGGDGIAVARLLHLEGIDVEMHIVGDILKGTEDARTQYRIAGNFGVKEVPMLIDKGYTTIVDAIFGVGLSRDVTGSYGDAIDFINAQRAKVLAVDISSGIHSDNGRVMGKAVRAHETVTFAFEKIGHLLYPGAEYTGKLTIADIGITEAAFAEGTPAYRIYEDTDVRRILPRKNRSNKGTYGKVFVIAGSKGMAGAAYLVAAGACRSGCGLVRIATEEANRPILQTLLPEAMTYGYDKEHPDFSRILEYMEWADSIVFGPGTGTGAREQELLKFVLENCKKPLILDADGITMVSDVIELQKILPERCIITPHPGEMARFMNMSIPEVVKDISGTAEKCAAEHRVICVLKDARTVTAAPDGRMAVNCSGNDGMATGGSGDVLSGAIAAAAACQEDLFKAAALGVHMHGAAGDLTAKALGKRGMLSGDLAEQLLNI